MVCRLTFPRLNHHTNADRQQKGQNGVHYALRKEARRCVYFCEIIETAKDSCRTPSIAGHNIKKQRLDLFQEDGARRRRNF